MSQEKIIDFSKSYVMMNSIHRHNSSVNITTYNSDIKHRFQIESILKFDNQLFYQCCSCKAENALFTNTNFFQKNNYDFLPVFTKKAVYIFRRHAFVNKHSKPYCMTYRDINKNNWHFKIKNHTNIKELTTNKMVANAVSKQIPIIGKTTIGNDILYYPIKTININDKSEFQVDTGIMPFPYKDGLCLAFIIFNDWHYAEVILEQPTKIGLFKKAMGYSKVIPLYGVVNELYGVEESGV